MCSNRQQPYWREAKRGVIDEGVSVRVGGCGVGVGLPHSVQTARPVVESACHRQYTARFTADGGACQRPDTHPRIQ